jgi:hypothetical protein
MQRDREEMLAMQRQMQMMGDEEDGEDDGGDTFDDRYYGGASGYADHDASMMFQFNGENDFMGKYCSCCELLCIN